MDTGKLLQIIQDTQDEESIASTQASLNNIIAFYGQNTAEGLESIATEKQKLHSTLTELSPISKYAASDFHAMEKIGISKIFGPGLYQRLEEILASPTYEIAGLLQELVAERDQAITNLASMQTGMVHFDLKSRELDDNNYEIGFTLPENYSDLDKTESALKDFRLVLESLADATDSQQPLRIKYVSNGTIEYFIHAGVDLAQNFDVLLDYAIKIYTAIKMYEDGKKFVKNFKANRKKQVNSLVDEQKKEDVNGLIESMVKELNIATDKQAEVTGRFKEFLKHIQAGVCAEVRTPKLQAPEEPAEGSTKQEKLAHKQALANYEKKKEIDQRNQQIFILQQNNFYGMDTKFLTEPETSNMKKDSTN